MNPLTRLWRMLRGTNTTDELQAADAHEAAVLERLARISGKTPAQVRAEARRRALQFEVQSIRRRR